MALLEHRPCDAVLRPRYPRPAERGIASGRYERVELGCTKGQIPAPILDGIRGARCRDQRRRALRCRTVLRFATDPPKGASRRSARISIDTPEFYQMRLQRMLLTPIA